MKKITLVCSIASAIWCFSPVHAQSQLWGMTSSGGEGFGTIFKTDGNGNNHQVMETFSPAIDGMHPVGNKLCEMPNGKLLGITSADGLNNAGIIFEYDPSSNNYVKKIRLNNATGGTCNGSLTKASNGKLYGMTSYGGAHNRGVIFEYDYALNTFTPKIDFDSAGGNPLYGTVSLIEATNGKLYGTTSRGGAHDMGVIFEYDYTTNTYSKKIDMDSASGSVPLSSLMQASNGKLYGVTRDGGANNLGVIYEYDFNTNTYIKKIDLSTTSGRNPNCTLLEAGNGKLYGMTIGGGAAGFGTIFEYDYSTNTFTMKMNFNQLNGWSGGSFMEASNGKLYGMTRFGGTGGGEGVIFEYDYGSNTFTKKVDFDGVNGDAPLGVMIQASNGKLYGTTMNGGIGGEIHNDGVLFEYDFTNNTYTKKIDFNLAVKGSYPGGSLTRASNGKLYGLASGGGGAHGLGSLFEYDYSANAYTKKIDLDSSTGYYPQGSLIEASNGKLYGMANGGINGAGVLFEYNYATDAYSKKVDLSNANGNTPSGSLTQASNGKLYGTTILGGTTDDGVIFEYDYNTDTYTKKIDLNSNGTGSRPVGSMVAAGNGKLYGMTGIGDFGVSPGWIFEYDYATNTYTQKVTFSNTDGRDPQGSLIQAANGKLYGMTSAGGTNNKGVIFEYDYTTNTYTKKIDLNGIDGSYPSGTLMQASNGMLYGMTTQGGANNRGVLFEYDYSTNNYTKKLDFNGVNGSAPAWSSLLEINGTTGIENVKDEFRLAVFPNPSNSVFTVDFSIPEKEDVRLTLKNELGMTVYSEIQKGFSGNCKRIVDLKGQPCGVYVLELSSASEKTARKIIIQ